MEVPMLTFERFIKLLFEEDNDQWGTLLLNHYIEKKDHASLLLVSKTTKNWVKAHKSSWHLESQKRSRLWHQFVTFWTKGAKYSSQRLPKNETDNTALVTHNNLTGSLSEECVPSATLDLFSLSGIEEAKLRLLNFLSTGENGLADLLNFRLVCSTTKGWIDSLPSKSGQQIFSHIKVRVNLQVPEILEKFLKTLPPIPITSLSLDLPTNPEKFKPIRIIKAPRKSASRLKYLEIDSLVLPLDDKISHLVSSTTLKSFRCKHFDTYESAVLPDFLFELEELYLERYFLGPGIREQLYEGCAASRDLQVLELFINLNTNFSLLAALINDDRRKQTKFSFIIAPNTFLGPQHANLLETFGVFLTSILENMKNIQFKDLDAFYLLKLKTDFVSLNVFTQFARTIFSLNGFGGHEFNGPDYNLLENFTNLNKLSGRLLTNKDLPSSVRYLEVTSGFPFPLILPEKLTALKLSNVICNVQDFIEKLAEINNKCPGLQILELRVLELDTIKKSSWIPSSNEQRFQNLRTFSLFLSKCEGNCDTIVEGIQQVLFVGLELPNLLLRELVVAKHHNMMPIPVFNPENLMAMDRGPISRTLSRVRIDGGLVAEEARPLLRNLKGYQEYHAKLVER